jgi:DNA-binding NarL/FixJ family response regulator
MGQEVEVIVVADGDKHARGLAVAALRRAGYGTIEADTGAKALSAARQDGVSLVLLELAFSDMTGYEVCRELQPERDEGLPVFFTSGTRTEAMDRVAGLMLGADDFIVKPFDPDELVARVRRSIRRAMVVLPQPLPTNERPRLTDRERQVLAMLAEGQRQKEIALALSISQKTVATHIQNLLGKFGVHSRTELVARAYVLGLVTARVTAQVA